MIQRKIVVAVCKGGVGKTTSAVNLSHGLARRGHKVLLVDCDAQGNATAMLGVQPERNLYHLMVENAKPDDVIVPARKNLDLIGANEMVALVNQWMVMQVAREKLLAKRLAPLYNAKRYNYIILDTAPTFSLLNICAMRVASEALVPVSMEFLSMMGVRQSLDHIGILNQELGHQLGVTYLVPTLADARYAKTDEIMRMLRKSFKGALTNPIHSNVKISEAPSFAKTIFEYDPKSRGAKDYLKLVNRIVRDEAKVARRPSRASQSRASRTSRTSRQSSRARTVRRQTTRRRTAKRVAG